MGQIPEYIFITSFIKFIMSVTNFRALPAKLCHITQSKIVFEFERARNANDKLINSWFPFKLPMHCRIQNKQKTNSRRVI